MMVWRRSRQQRINLVIYVVLFATILYFFGFDFLPGKSNRHFEPDLNFEQAPARKASAPKHAGIPDKKPGSLKQAMARKKASSLKQANAPEDGIVPEAISVSQHAKAPASKKPPPVPGEGDVEMVVASMMRENTTWLHDYLLDWRKNIYVVDDPTAPLTVPMNKGREAMVFLTYIIDRYDTLPGNIIFHHAERFQWHNDNPDYDALPLLHKFRFEHLRSQGYVNLRCVWVLGCPSEIHPAVDDVPGDPDEPIHARHVYKRAYEELFPEFPVPADIGVNCCSQFAARRETIWSRPKKDYVRYRQWLIDSTLPDDLSGRVLEYAWHIIFGKKPVHCPDAGYCYCQTYGICDVDCDEDKCPGQYTLPPFSTLPRGWPHYGWANEDREWKGLP